MPQDLDNSSRTGVKNKARGAVDDALFADNVNHARNQADVEAHDYPEYPAGVLERQRNVQAVDAHGEAGYRNQDGGYGQDGQRAVEPVGANGRVSFADVGNRLEVGADGFDGLFVVEQQVLDDVLVFF